jgi:predicted amidophosphoribosyltransferase
MYAFFSEALRLGKSQAQKENICSLCKENLEGSQILCWTCLCEIKDKVRKETQKDILEMIEKIFNKYNREIAGGEYWMMAFLSFERELTQKIKEMK